MDTKHPINASFATNQCCTSNLSLGALLAQLKAPPEKFSVPPRKRSALKPGVVPVLRMTVPELMVAVSPTAGPVLLSQFSQVSHALL